MICLKVDQCCPLFLIIFTRMTIFSADERGRWWIVGSAWSGEEKSDLSNAETTKQTENYSVKLLALAKKQRMNTETRKQIFCIIMSAEVRASENIRVNFEI